MATSDDDNSRTRTEYEIFDADGKLITTEPHERGAQNAVNEFDTEAPEGAPHRYEAVDTGEPLDDDRLNVKCENDACDGFLVTNATFAEAMQTVMEHKNSDHPVRVSDADTDSEGPPNT